MKEGGRGEREVITITSCQSCLLIQLQLLMLRLYRLETDWEREREAVA